MNQYWFLMYSAVVQSPAERFLRAAFAGVLIFFQVSCSQTQQPDRVDTPPPATPVQAIAAPVPHSEVKAAIDALQKRFAPDKRTELFLTEMQEAGDSLLITVEVGQTAAKKALDSLNATLTAPVRIQTLLLPDASVGNKGNAVVNISVCNIRSRPEHAAELATQALLGVPLKIWKKKGSWYLVQTPDRYLGWVDGGGIERMTDKEADRWQAQTKAIFTPIFGMAYEKPDPTAATITDLTAGNIVATLEQNAGFTKIGLPDGRQGYVPDNQLQNWADWLATTKPSEAALVSTARRMMGIPYLWGGTSAKGMDCSGFTKTIYWLNGLIIPRDASQQVWAGDEIDSKRDFSKLRPGDLLFFGRPATDSTEEKVIHVGMWIGNGEFIHASGMIRIGSMNPKAANFDKYEYDRYLRTKRLINAQNEKYLIAPAAVIK
ncbi:C40 family peptidase [Rhodoflexus sp.]